MSPLGSNQGGRTLETMMSIKEAERLGVMRLIDKKDLSLSQASLELGLSIRQVKRIRKRYQQEGDQGLISRRRGHPSGNKIPNEVRDRVLEILRDPKWADWGPTFATEKLALLHGIRLSDETIRQWMIQEGLWKSHQKQERRIHPRRMRRSRFGELIQGDGSHHDWFEGRAERCALLIFVDDATSRLTAGLFFPAETTEGYLAVLEQHLKKYGRPVGLYVDKHSVFRANGKKASQEEAETHFARVLRELEIQLIFAHSPQAKGRVERVNGTLQDRLVKEMRLREIKSIEEANQFLPQFIKEHNEKFEREPSIAEDAHRMLRKSDDLERIFARKETRKLSKNLTFQYEGTLYQIQTNTPNRIRKTHVEVLTRPGKAVIVKIGGKVYGYTLWEEKNYRREVIMDSKELMTWGRGKVKPTRNHPWRR